MGCVCFGVVFGVAFVASSFSRVALRRCLLCCGVFVFKSNLLDSPTRVDGEDRFKEEFGPGDKDEIAEDKERLGRIGPDHHERFGGNNDDHFRFGIQLHRKYARLFAPFYSESCRFSCRHAANSHTSAHASVYRQ